MAPSERALGPKSRRGVSRRADSHRVPPAPRFIPELDGLRGVAILLVFLTHFWAYPAGFVSLNRIAAAGWTGVDLFFVLSGFLITGILWETRNRENSFRNFYARRALRIFPLYYLLLFIVFFLLPDVSDSPGLHRVSEDRLLYFAYLANVALAAGGWQLFLLDITWSLSVEEQFYLVWPSLLRWLTVRRMLILCVGLILLAPVARTVAFLGLGLDWKWMHMLTPFRTDSFAMGAVVSILMKEGLVRGEAVRRCAFVVLGLVGPVLAGLVLTGNFRRESLLVGTIGYTLVSLTAAGLLVAALHPGDLARTLLGHRALRHVGKVSYGLYIYHPLCLMLGSTALAVVGLESDRVGDATLGTSVLQLVGASLFTLGIAIVSFTYFERPFLRLKRFFAADAAVPDIVAPSAAEFDIRNRSAL